MPPAVGDRWSEVCSSCGRTWFLGDLRWECTCGGLLDLVGPLADPFGGAEDGSPLARFRWALPPGAGRVDLGLTVSSCHDAGPGRYIKADYEQPTGSFKDRGAAVMVGAAAELGVESIVVDSSGNAGKAAAAYAAAAGIRCTVYLPSGTNLAKTAAIAGYGAETIEVPEGREAAARAARQAARAGAWYASHVHQPLFHHGVKTLAYELFEQVPGCERASVVIPAGNGTLVLGLWLGFGELVALGRLTRRPALIAVQADRCAPLAGRLAGAAGGPTVAAGIAIRNPPRSAQIRGAILASGGRVITVSDEAILAAQKEVGGMGFPVEPTGAVAWAGARSIESDGSPHIAVLTGRA